MGVIISLDIYNGSPFDFGLEYNEGQSEEENDYIA